MYSFYPPGQNPCRPNTDVTDCGWRMPKRMARIGIARSDDCEAGTAVSAPSGCLDYSDLMATPRSIGDRLPAAPNGVRPACGRGTQAAQCERLASKKIGEDTSTNKGPGTHIYNNEKYRNKTIYINPNIITAGAECVVPDKANLELSGWYSGTEAELLKYVCTDGGEGSFRVPLRMPAQTGVSGSTLAGTGPHYWEFLCPYGSQPEACPPRNLTDFQEIQDELVQPSGPDFPDCFAPDVPDYECCRSETAFRIHGGPGKVGQSNPEKDEYCAYPSVDANGNWIGALAADDPCPLHWTSYFHTSTGCEALCREAHKREGNDNTCVPNVPECLSWHDGDGFPLEYQTVTADCICGAKLRTEASAGDYVHPGSILSKARNYARRALHLDSEADDDGHWEWPEAPESSIDAHHGAHFDVPDACIAEIMSFRTDLILNGSGCDDYLLRTAPPDDLVQNGYDPTDSSTHHAYCGTEQPLCRTGAGESGGDLGYGVGLYTEAECRAACEAFEGCGAFDFTDDTSHAAANSCRFFRGDNVPRLGIAGRTYCWMETHAGDHACCVLSRGHAGASRVWYQAGSHADRLGGRELWRVGHRGHGGAHVARGRGGQL